MSHVDAFRYCLQINSRMQLPATVLELESAIFSPSISGIYNIYIVMAVPAIPMAPALYMHMYVRLTSLKFN